MASNRSTQKCAISDTDEHDKTQPKKKKAAESKEDGDEENPAAQNTKQMGKGSGKGRGGKRTRGRKGARGRKGKNAK
jgi:hypothetical protein